MDDIRSEDPEILPNQRLGICCVRHWGMGRASGMLAWLVCVLLYLFRRREAGFEGEGKVERLG